MQFFFKRNIKIEKKIIKAQIWDTAGQDRFKSISQAYVRIFSHSLLTIKKYIFKF